MKATQYFKILIRVVLVLLVLISLGYVGIRYEVYRVVSGHIMTSSSLPASNTTAVVLGASVEHDLVPSPTLQQRLSTAIGLYQSHKVSRLLMSGDSTSSPYYDEVSVMRQYVISHGVAASQVDVDGQGLRTYDTCYRLQNVYHFDKVVLITQPDHLQRAVYTCRKLGLDADGVETNQTTALLSDPNFFLHEQEAIILAWFDIHIFHPQPKPISA